MARTFALLASFALGVVMSVASPLGANAQIKQTSSGAPRSVVTDNTRSGAEIFDRAVRYEHGEGVAQDYDQALRLYCDAARLGEPNAFFNIGWMFLNARGVPRDDGIAALWLRKAADRGIAPAINLVRLLSNAGAATGTGCPATRMPVVAPLEIQKLVADVGPKIGVDPQLILAVIAVESAFDPRAVSPKQALGLMQLMPETAARFGVRDPFNVTDNVRAGVTYLRELLTLYDGNLTLALAAYNAGEAAVLKYGGVPPYDETKDYVSRVTRLCACGK